MLLAIGIPILVFVSYMIYKMRIGHIVAVHLYRFEATYDKVFQDTHSKEQALRHSLPIFTRCPILNRLREEDYERIIDILKESQSPKKIIHTIVLKMDTKTSVLALKNTQLLSRMASVGSEPCVEQS